MCLYSELDFRGGCAHPSGLSLYNSGGITLSSSSVILEDGTTSPPPVLVLRRNMRTAMLN